MRNYRTLDVGRGAELRRAVAGTHAQCELWHRSRLNSRDGVCASRRGELLARPEPLHVVRALFREVRKVTRDVLIRRKS